MDNAPTHPRGRRAIDRGGSPDPLADDVDQQAAEWHIRRLGDDWSAADEQVRLRWLQASDRHAAAYAHAERTWADLADLQYAPELLPVPAAAPRAALVSVPPSPARWHRRALGAGLGAAVLAAVALVSGNLADPLLAWRADQRTAVAEVRNVTLPDGSLLRLAGDSAVALHYSDTERRIDLLKGQVLFEAQPMVAHEPGGEHRPFVVAAGDGVTRALGTRFIVERLPGRTQVTGIEHRVNVALDRAPQSGLVLSPGQVVSYSPRGIEAVTSAGFDAGDAWDNGLLVFEQAPLADVAARFNRYRHGHILVRGNALAQRRISGVFKAADGDDALQAVADELGVRLLRLPALAVFY